MLCSERPRPLARAQCRPGCFGRAPRFRTLNDNVCPTSAARRQSAASLARSQLRIDTSLTNARWLVASLPYRVEPTTTLLDLVEEPSHQLACAIKVRAEVVRVLTIAFRRNVCPRALLMGKLPDPVRIVSGARPNHPFYQMWRT